MKDLTIVIPTYNESKDIVECLDSISKQKYDKKKFEVIIVDNCSTDKTVEIAKKYSKKIDLKIVFNKIKDAEVSKMVGFKKAKGQYFMYMDADMAFSDDRFIERMTFPLKHDKEIAGVFVKFLVNKQHPPLTRTLSYDPWQRDPIFRFFTASPNKIITEKKSGYFVCRVTKNTIPPQGLMIYRKKIIEEYTKDKRQLIDNDIPVAIFNEGYTKFAYVPETGIYHKLLRSLTELSRKRIRNLRRTYFPNQEKRLFKWINWKKDWYKAMTWLIYTHSFLPFITAIYKSLKYKDLALLNEPAINIVSTYSIVWAVLVNLKNGE
ncbi:glycosyltransferase family 2 protein [Candidatus Pacearchaeota archaeon]|nr:glycosyltransferase family 2 protein [Candidatus Pacearchaeota archaeon]